MATKTMTTTTMRRCTGSTRLGIEPHEAPISEFPKQPSRKDGLGTMCTEHWRAYVKGLREARKVAGAESAPEPEVIEISDEVAEPEAPARRARRRRATAKPEDATA